MVDPGHRRGGFFDELKRRRVVRVGIAYGAVVFVLLQLADIILPALDYSDAALRPFLIGSLVGFPVVLLLAWLFDLTPEGVVLTARTAEGRGRIVVSASRLVAGLGAVALLVVGVIAVVGVLRPEGAEGAVAEDARVIAVMPFRGAAENIMADGVMSLLSTNLDGIGSIRTIDPLLTLGRLSEAEQTGVITEQRALEVGGLVGAGSVLTGSIVTGGSEVRLAATLVATEDGRELASAEVEGPADDLFGLLDELSAKILRVVWRGDDLPLFDLASFTTDDFEAIRAFLEGERYYRASQWDSAMASFARAINEDDEFALAYYRFATAAGWGGSFRTSQLGTPGGLDPSAGDLERQAAEAARAHSAGLPERERLLITALWLRATDRRPEALDTIKALVGRFPDDLEAAYQLADDVYHVIDEPSGLLGRSLEERLGLFDDVLAKEPGFRPALIHPLGLAFASGRIDLVERYLDYLRPSNPLDQAALETYEAAFDALVDPDLFGFARAFETALSAREQTGFVWQAASGILPPLLVAAARLEADDRDELIEYLAQGLADLRPETRELRALMAADLMIASGRARDAAALLEVPDVARLVENERVALIRRAAYAGLLPGDHPELEPPARVAAQALAAIDRGDPDALRSALRDAADAAALPDSADRAELEARLRPFLTVLEGDTVGGLRAIEASLADRAPVAGSRSEALWFRWATIAVAHAPSRARALAALQGRWTGSGRYELGRLRLRAAGLRLDGSADADRAEALWCLAAPDDAFAGGTWQAALPPANCEELDDPFGDLEDGDEPGDETDSGFDEDEG
ncbi:MAG: hypothetical protein ABFS34_09460 [Gemmatimonadota bacterium]